MHTRKSLIAMALASLLASGAMAQSAPARASTPQLQQVERDALELGALTCSLAKSLDQISDRNLDRAQFLQDRICGAWSPEKTARWEAVVAEQGWRTSEPKMNRIIRLAGHREEACGPLLPTVQDVIRQCGKRPPASTPFFDWKESMQ